MNLLKEFFSAFQKGKMLARPEVWKNRAILADTLAALLTSALAISAAFGYSFQVEDDAIRAIAAGVAAAVYLGSAVLHVTTSEKVGLPSRDERKPGGGEAGPEDFQYPLGGA